MRTELPPADRAGAGVPDADAPQRLPRLPWEIELSPDEVAAAAGAGGSYNSSYSGNSGYAGNSGSSGNSSNSGSVESAAAVGLGAEFAGGAAVVGQPFRASRVRVGVGAAVVLVIVALVAAVLVSMFSPHGRTEVVALPTSRGSAPPLEVIGLAKPLTGTAADGTAPTSIAPTGTAAGSEPPILLHVLGAVAHPGLYKLHTGDRVVDAVAAAGGFSPTADQTQQNLARVVADGEQLVIPEQGAAPPLGSVAAGAAGSGTAGSGGGAGTPALVNLNTADQTALETLPQVGPAMAQRIIAWRTENGPFTQLDDLKNVTGIGDKTFETLKPLVTI